MRPIETRNVPIEIEKPSKPNLPPPPPIKVRKVKWNVLVTKQGPFMCVTPENYEILAENILNTLNYIKQCNTQLDYYSK